MNWVNAAPEIFYFAASMLFFLLSFGSGGKPHRLAVTISALGIIVCLASLKAHGWIFTKGFQADLFAQLFKVLISIGLFLTLLICGRIADISEKRHNEFYFLLFTCTLALMLLVSADHLLSIYVSLEVSSYSLYILTALRKREAFAVEAGIKYFLIGSFASAIMLLGMVLLYSACGSAYLSDLSLKLPASINDPIAIAGILLTLGGFFFKLAVFPFHFWAPDTYQGASNEVAAYIATASKVAGIAVLVRVVSSTGQGSRILADALVILSVISMTLGNLAAITQKDIKRLLAFSTIAHSGYVLIGILVLTPAGYSGAVFYALALLAMKFTAFMVVVELASDGRNLQLKELAGLHKRSPILAMALLVSLFSLAGIPPTIGFTGKFLIFAAAIQKGYIALVIIAMINVVISLYYYLLAIHAAYLLEPVEALPPLDLSFPKKLLAGVSSAAIVFAGFFPNQLIQIAQNAVKSLGI